MQPPSKHRLSVAELIQSIPEQTCSQSATTPSYDDDHRLALAKRAMADVEAGRARILSNQEVWESTEHHLLRDVRQRTGPEKPFLYRPNRQIQSPPDVKAGSSSRLTSREFHARDGAGVDGEVGEENGRNVFAWERGVLRRNEAMKQANLYTLPAHLLGRIAGLLGSSDRCSLMRVCKATLHPVASVIYSHVFIVHAGRYDLISVLSGMENDRYTRLKPYGRGLKLAFLKHVKRVEHSFTQPRPGSDRPGAETWHLDALLRAIPNEIIIFPKLTHLVFRNCAPSNRGLMDSIISRSQSQSLCIHWVDDANMGEIDKVKGVVFGGGHVPQTVIDHNLRLSDDIDVIFSHACLNRLEFQLEGEARGAIAEQWAEVVLNIMRDAYGEGHGYGGSYDEDGGTIGMLFTEWEIVGIGKLSENEEGTSSLAGEGEEAEAEDQLDEEEMMKDVKSIVLDQMAFLAGRIRFTATPRGIDCAHCKSTATADEEDWVVV